MTNKEIIAEVINDLRALQIDDRVSQRFVLSKLKNLNALYLKRENDQLRLYDDNNVWFTIECLEMEVIDPKNYPDGCKGANVINKIHSYTRSKFPVPEIYSSKIGPLIREVQTMDDASFYQPTTPIEYGRIVQREFRNPNIKYFWFDGMKRLVIPNSQSKMVTLTASFREPYLARLIDACKTLTETVSSFVPDNTCQGDVTSKVIMTHCPEPLEDPFLCPSHLLAVVKQDTTKDLFDFYKRNITDPVPDGDNNSKQDRK